MAGRREFLRRIKQRFDERSIAIPFPHQTLYFGASKDGSAPPVHVDETRSPQGDWPSWLAEPVNTSAGF